MVFFLLTFKSTDCLWLDLIISIANGSFLVREYFQVWRLERSDLARALRGIWHKLSVPDFSHTGIAQSWKIIRTRTDQRDSIDLSFPCLSKLPIDLIVLTQCMISERQSENSGRLWSDSV